MAIHYGRVSNGGGPDCWHHSPDTELVWMELVMTTATKEILLPWRVEEKRYEGRRTYHKIKDPKDRTIASLKSRRLAEFMVEHANLHTRYTSDLLPMHLRKEGYCSLCVR